jgi:hypothetical protein
MIEMRQHIQDEQTDKNKHVLVPTMTRIGHHLPHRLEKVRELLLEREMFWLNAHV